MRTALRDLEVLKEELRRICNRINVQSGNELHAYNLNKALRLIDNQIIEVVDFIEQEEEKERNKEM